MQIDRNALLAGALFLGVFVCGAVVGGAVVRGFSGPGLSAGGPPHGPRGPHGHERGPPRPERVVDELERELGLDAEQKRAVAAAVADTARAIDGAFTASEDRMRAVLRPDQLERFEAFVARRKQHGPGPGGPPGERGPPPLPPG